MDKFLQLQKIIRTSGECIKSSNYNFERHFCDVKNEEVKVDFDFTFEDVNSDDFVVFGQCKYCNKIFYNIDFD